MEVVFLTLVLAKKKLNKKNKKNKKSSKYFFKYFNNP